MATDGPTRALPALHQKPALRDTVRGRVGAADVGDVQILRAGLLSGTHCQVGVSAGLHDRSEYRSAAGSAACVGADGLSNIAANGNGASDRAPVHHVVEHHDETNVKFQEFWDAYPEKYGNPKTPALSIFRAVVKAGTDPDLIIRGAKNYAADIRRSGKGQDYTAHAKTWLNQRRWEEYQREPELPKSRAGMV
jgi:hypothetical protein